MRNHKKIVWLVGSLLILSIFVQNVNIVFAQEAVAKTPENIEGFDAALGKLLQDNKIPGASVSLIEGGKIVLNKGYGLADVVEKKPVTTDTIFRAGSVSKSMIGVAAMLLVEEGKLDLNAKLSDLAPEIKFTNPWEATDPVRFVHLLEHTSGFPDVNFRQIILEGDLPLKETVEKYGPYTSMWRPGTLMAYSNSAPVIAAYIIEKISGKSFYDFTTERIFKPLGMTSAHWNKPTDNLAKSYKEDGVTEEPYINILGKPAGGLSLTSEDLAKFTLMLLNRGTYNGVKILSPSSVDRIETPTSPLAIRSGLTLGYGLGNQPTNEPKTVFHGHNGSIDAFLTTYMYDSKNNSGFVLMVNTASKNFDGILRFFLDYLERSLPTPKVATIAPKAEDLKDIAGFYQTAALPMPWLRPFSVLSIVPISVVPEGLSISGKIFKPVGPKIFQDLERSKPNAVFVSTEDGMYMFSPNGTLHRTPMIEIIALALFGIFYVVSLLVSLVLLFVWIIGGIRRRLKGLFAWSIRLNSLVALSLLLVFPITLLSADTNDLGVLTLRSSLIFCLSLLLPVSGLVSLVLAYKSGPETKRFIKILAWTSGILILIGSIYFARYGLIGIRTWK